MIAVSNTQKAEIISFDLLNSLIKLRLYTLAGDVSAVRVCAFNNCQITDVLGARQALDRFFADSGACAALVEERHNALFATIFTPDGRNVNSFLIRNDLAREG